MELQYLVNGQTPRLNGHNSALSDDALSMEIAWLESIFQERISRPEDDILQLPGMDRAPRIDAESCWGACLLQSKANPVERIALMLSLLPTLSPSTLVRFSDLLAAADDSPSLWLHGILYPEKSVLPISHHSDPACNLGWF
jgi:hypothetical protein